MTTQPDAYFQENLQYCDVHITIQQHFELAITSNNRSTDILHHWNQQKTISSWTSLPKVWMNNILLDGNIANKAYEFVFTVSPKKENGCQQSCRACIHKKMQDSPPRKNYHESMSMNSFEGVAFCTFPTVLSANKGPFSNSTLVTDDLTALHR